MKSTDQDCGSSSTYEGSPKSKRQKREDVGPTCQVEPPDPRIVGLSEDDQSSQPFPDFVDLSLSNVHPATEHCILHCDHEICLYTKDIDEKHGQSPQACQCQSTPQIPEAVHSAPRIQVTGDLLQHVAHVCRSLSGNMNITIHLSDTLDLLSQLETQLEHYPIFLQLADEIAYRLPGQQSIIVTSRVYILFFQDVEKFFTRAISLHGQVSQQWNTSVGALHTEWRNCMYATMVDFIEMQFPRVLEQQTITPPGVAQDYIHDGVPKLVWAFWTRVWEELVKILAWRHVQVTRIEVEAASPGVSRG